MPDEEEIARQHTAAATIQARLRSHLLAKASTDGSGGDGNAPQEGSPPPSSPVPASGGGGTVDGGEAAREAGTGAREDKPSTSKATVQIQVGAVYLIDGG